MDILAHAILNYIIFLRTDFVVPAIIFGVLPDLIVHIPEITYRLAKRSVNIKDWYRTAPKFVIFLDDLTHSFVVFGILLAVVWIVFRSIPLYLFGWLVHIIADPFFHDKTFFPKKIFWPLSEYYFTGLPLNRKRLTIVYLILFVLLLIRVIF